VQKGVDLFRRFPKIGLLAFKIGAVEKPDEPLREHWWHPQPLDVWKDRFFLTDYFPEGAVFFRAEVLRQTGGYDEDFFWGFESVDLSLRLLRDGFELLYCPVLACGEIRIRGIQTNRRLFINYLSLRNRLWIVWKHYPFWRGACYAAARIGMACLRSLRYGWTDHFIRGVRDGIVAPASIRRRRQPLSRHFWKRIDCIRSGFGYASHQDRLDGSPGSTLQVAYGAHEFKK
jgi:GT2 family glycosyltransferase